MDERPEDAPATWLTPGRYRRLQDMVEEAAVRPASEVDRFLDVAAEGNARLRAEAKALLDARLALSVSVADVREGSVIGPYRIGRELGEGGMGTVYLARRADEVFDKTVAIKLIRADADGQEFLSRFALERRILASLDHPNIARLIDGGTLGDGRPYLVMEYVDGVPLNAFADRARLNVRERIQLLQTVCVAVEHAHQQLIIHRDLKPSNILVGTDGTPKLLDFGIARVLRRKPALADQLTATNFNPHTPGYASPEQVGGGSVGTASDVYALGVIAHEMLAGVAPARASTGAITTVPSRAVNGPAAAPLANARGTTIEGLRRQLAGDLDAIVLKALHEQSAYRYHSASAFREDLQRHIDRLPVEARPPTFLYKGTRFLRRNTLAVAAAVTLIVSLVGGITGTYLQWQRAEGSRRLAERRFSNVRGLASSVLEISSTLGSSPDAVAARDSLVVTSLRYLDQLEREAGGDRWLLREVAAAYRRVGDVQKASYSPDSAAQSATALVTYERALRVSENLAKAEPAAVETRRDLAQSLDRVGTVLAETGDTKRSADTLERSLTLYEQLVTADRNSANAQRDLAQAHVRYGDAVGTIDPDAARRSYEQAGKISRDLAARPDVDQAVRADLTTINAQLRAKELPANPEEARIEEERYYEAVRDSTDAERLAYFLERFPDGEHNQEIRERLDAVRAGRPLPARGAKPARAPSRAPVIAAAPVVERPSAPVLPVARMDAGIEWRQIPAGAFDMGCDLRPDRSCNADERPRHRVTLSRAFRMAASETTLGQYRRYAAALGQPIPAQPAWNTGDRQPIVNVTWDQAEQFCAAAGARLPTEAEWEWAAMGGSTNVYPWGNAYVRTAANAGFPGRDGWDTAAPAGTFPANGYGLLEMAGNVWEWVHDWYGEQYYRSDAVTDPTGPPNGPSRVLRGGSYSNAPNFLRVTQRGRDLMDRRREATGFRCAQ